jgi:excinuclease UvrABC nuclease subunit
MEKQMNAASEVLDFERAARLRDNIGALKRALEKQTVVFGDGTDADVVAFADDDLEAAVQVFHVRGGRVRGQRGWVVEKSGEPGESGQELLVEQFLTQFYGDQAELGGTGDDATNPVPREVLVPVLPGNAEELEIWLSDLRGSRVKLRVPHRGDKRALGETVHRNAQDALVTSTRDQLHCRAFRSRSALQTHRCASSASTSATSRAPTWWRPWWCSRTGCPASRTTGTTPSARPPATAVPTTWRPSPR